MTYQYRGNRRNDPKPQTCGEKIGTLAGYSRHYRAGEYPCGRCKRARAKYLADLRSGAGGDEHRRQAIARSRAKSELVRRHREEFEALYRAAHAELTARPAGTD